MSSRATPRPFLLARSLTRVVFFSRSDMEAVQNLRTAIYSFKLRVEAADEGSKKREKLFDQALNYLYRCAFPLPALSYLCEASELMQSPTSTGTPP